MPELTGNSKEIVVTFKTPHKAWKKASVLLRTESLCVACNADGSITLKSREGKLEQVSDFVVVRPGWYDATSSIDVQTDKPVIRNSVMFCYPVIQVSNKRTGYILSFKEESDNE